MPRDKDLSAEEATIVVPAPLTCPGCGSEWEAAGGSACPRCTLERSEAIALLREACSLYNAARSAAQDGRFAEARRYLEEAKAGGLASHPAVQELDALCARALGLAPVPAEVRDTYEAVRQTAREGRFDVGLKCLAAVCKLQALTDLAHLPLPVYKLALLCLAGADTAVQADHLRHRLLDRFPGEPDLVRWRFVPARGVPPPLPTQVMERRAIRRPIRPKRPRSASRAPKPSAFVPVSEWRRLRLWATLAGVGALAASVLAGGALFVAVSLALSPPSPLPHAVGVRPGLGEGVAREIPEREQESAASTRVSTPPSPTAWGRGEGGERAASFPPSLNREREAARSEADLQTARRWFNTAVRAYEEGSFREALRWATATHALASKTYLGDEALLLCARASDNDNGAVAEKAWARIAAEYPASPYAPLGLRRAAQIAQRHGRRAEASVYRKELVTRYPRSPQAERIVTE